MKIYFAAFFASLTFGLCCTVFLMNEESSEAIRAALTMNTRAQPEPVAMIAVAPGERLADHINYVVSAIGMSSYHCGFVAGVTENLLTGIDRTRPMGALVFVDEDSEKPLYVVALPIADLDKLKKSMAQFGTIDQSAWGTTVQLKQGDLLMIKKVDDYVFVSNNKKCFGYLPDDPADLFGSLVADHTINIQVNGQQIPQERKDVLWAGFKAGAKSGLVRQESPIEMDHMMNQIKGLIYDVEFFNVAIDVNEQTKTVSIGTELIGTEGSWICDRANKNLTMKPTQFAGFRQKNAVFNLLGCSNTSSDDLRAWKSNVKRVLDQARNTSRGQIPELPTWLTHLDAAFEETLNSDRVDFGATMVLKQGKANIAMGVYVADSTHIEKLVSDACHQIEKNNAPTRYRTSFAEHRSIVFHEFIGDTDIDEVNQTFGKNTRFTIGVGEQAVYLAMGESGFELLKKCIDDTVDTKPSDSLVSLGEVSLAPLFRMMPDHPISRYAANLAHKTKGHDKLQIESFPVQNGFVSRFNIHTGFVKTVIKTITQVGAYASNRPSGPIRVDSAKQRTQIPFSSMELTN